MIANIKYGVNNMSMKKRDRQKFHDMEMYSLSSMCWVTKMDKARNDELSLSIGVRDEPSDIEWIESICSGLDTWGVWVGADAWNSVCVECGCFKVYRQAWHQLDRPS